MEISTCIGIIIAVGIILIGLFLFLRKPKQYEPSLDTELHINPETNMPIIPRFVRDQLKSTADEQVTETAQQEPQIEELDAPQHTDAPVVLEKAEDEQTPVKEIEEKTQPDEVVLEDEPKLKVEKPAPVQPEVERSEIKEFDEESSLLDIHLHEQQCYDDASALANAQHIIALNVYPGPRRVLAGDKALKILIKYGLRFGEMSCFHRYENTEEPSPLMFSVLRVTDEGPAGFDLETLSAEQVQGFAFFLALPNANAQKGFDMMASIAGLIARDIDGKVFDENNSELSPQLKEHLRHQVIDFKPQATTE